MNRKKIFIVFIVALFAVVLIVAGIALGKLTSQPDKHIIAGTVDRYAEEQQYDDLIENESISIPGYDSFEFKANQIKQDIILYNPKENTCYFKISFILEDGTNIWTSELLEPDMCFTSINLGKTLDAGIYENVQVKYECYSLKTLEQLNGADIKITIYVK